MTHVKHQDDHQSACGVTVEVGILVGWTLVEALARGCGSGGWHSASRRPS
jgi:hypothetical protein